MAWLEAMSHPDRGIAFFNDAAFGVSPEPAQLRAYAARLDVATSVVRAGGCAAIDAKRLYQHRSARRFIWCVMSLRSARTICPPMRTRIRLSFELSFRGRRVFVNSGTSEYGLGAERQRQRGTAAHNTLVLDDEDSSEMWAGFRVARRARARLLEARAEDSAVSVVGEHDGYRRLRGRNMHRRSWTLNAQSCLIEDVVEGGFRSAKCLFHLHPEIRVQRAGDSELQLSDPRGVSARSTLRGRNRRRGHRFDLASGVRRGSGRTAASWRSSAGRAWQR